MTHTIYFVNSANQFFFKSTIADWLLLYADKPPTFLLRQLRRGLIKKHFNNPEFAFVFNAPEEHCTFYCWDGATYKNLLTEGKCVEISTGSPTPLIFVVSESNSEPPAPPSQFIDVALRYNFF